MPWASPADKQDVPQLETYLAAINKANAELIAINAQIAKAQSEHDDILAGNNILLQSKLADMDAKNDQITHLYVVAADALDQANTKQQTADSLLQNLNSQHDVFQAQKKALIENIAKRELDLDKHDQDLVLRKNTLDIRDHDNDVREKNIVDANNDLVNRIDAFNVQAVDQKAKQDRLDELKLQLDSQTLSNNEASSRIIQAKADYQAILNQNQIVLDDIAKTTFENESALLKIKITNEDIKNNTIDANRLKMDNLALLDVIRQKNQELEDKHIALIKLRDDIIKQGATNEQASPMDITPDQGVVDSGT